MSISIRLLDCLKTVSALAYGFDENPCAACIQLASQVRDVSLDDVGVMGPIVVIEVLQQLLLRYQGPWPVHEVFKDAVLGSREVQHASVTMDDLLYRVDLEIEDLKLG